MHLQIDPCLADLPGFSREQLQALTRSVELKKQKLEDDINHYIARKQEELRNHERELIAHHRSMDDSSPSRDRNANDGASDDSQPSIANHSPNPSAVSPQPADPSPSTDSTALGPDEKAKRTKHTRVHKREKELFGLVTPIFLPLLEAGDPTPPKKKPEKRKEKVEVVARPASPIPEQASPSRDVDKAKEKRRSRSRPSEEKMECGEEPAAVAGETSKENHKPDSEKKKRRSAIKKSSLRHNNAPRARRKRVSLVIDDQIVLPADSIIEPPLTSPSETTISTASNSTTSLDELVDPRLLSPRYDKPAHQDPVHHSIPLPTSLPSTSPTKHTGHTLSESPSQLEHAPPRSASRTSPELSPTQPDIDLPPHTSSQPIYASRPEALDLEEVAEGEAGEEDEFSTYVGGLSGSGVDNVDQAGSYGYPSSLGASYLESYMQSRPLSVRLAAAERTELAENERKKLLQGVDGKEEEEEEEADGIGIGKGGDGKADQRVHAHADVDDDMEVIGEMEGF